MKRLLAFLALLSFCGLAALAQSEGDQDDNGFLINMLQNQLSGPGRQIHVQGVSGLLSSRARIEQVTVSDDDGAWLTMRNVALDWTRSALLLGRVNVNRLAADEIILSRRPEIPPTPVLEQTEAKPFEVPSLPVRVQVRELSIGRFSLGQPVAGVAAELSLDGSLSLARGTLDTRLAAKRLDAPGGALDLRASFANDTRQLGLDLHLQEPKGGLVATLLNIENQPPIDLRVTGDGPLDNVDITLALDADGQRLAGGALALRANDQGLGFTADLKGGIAPLIPASYRDFFAGETALSANGLRKNDGGTRIDALSLKGAVLSLDGSLDTTADGFPRAIDLTGTLGDPAAPPVTLPVPGAATTLNSARLYLSYGQATRWNGFLVLDRLATKGVAMEDVTLNLGGLAEDLEDPAKRLVTLAAEGLATGVTAEDPGMAAALGSRFDLFADAAMPPGGPIAVRQSQLSGSGLSIFSAGTFEDWTYTGRNSVRVDDLAPFGAIVGRALGGAVDLDANGSVSPLSGGFDLTLAGSATDVAIGDTRADALMAGETTLGGRVARDQNGIRAEGLRIGNAQFSLASDGRISSTATDFTFEASLADLGKLDPRLAGALSAQGTAKGTGRDIDVDLSADIPEGRLMDRPLTGAELGFTGTVSGFGTSAGTTVAGDLRGGGQFGDQALSLAGNVDTTGGQQKISGLRAAVGPNTIAGDILRAADGLITGSVALRAPDIAPIAALALVDGAGSMEADLAFAPENGSQGVTVSANGRDIAIAGNSIASVNLQAEIADAFGVPMVNGTLAGESIRAGGVEVASLNAKAQQTEPNRMTFAADSRLAIGTLIDTTGTLDRLDPGMAVTLSTLRLRQDPRVATLTQPATITLKDGTTTLTPLTLDFGTGRLSAQGTIADMFDLALRIDALPLDIANAIQPTLGAAGQITGTASVTGPRSAPNVSFDVAGSGLGVAQTRDAGVPPLALTATGATRDGRLSLDAQASAPNGLDLRVAGGVPMAQGGTLDLALNLNQLPLAMVDGLAGDQGLRGTVTGTGHVTGTLANPSATFSLDGAGLSADMLANGGVAPLTLRARGDFANRTLTIGEARLGGGGIDFGASGRVPLSGPGLDVSGSGTLPLALANAFLAERDAQAAGTARLEFRATGSLAAPVLSGSARMTGGTLVDPQTNVRLNDIALDATLANNTVRLANLSANAAAGGSLAASGTLGLGPGLPADLDLAIRNLRYTDGSFVATRLSGNLAANGPLLGNGLISGQIDLDATEISIAEGLGAGASSNLEQVIHHLPPPRVKETLARAQVGVPQTQTRESSGSQLRLDVLIRAPRQIFVRGRGLDVELGGETRIRGTVSDVQPVGQFDLRRGRLSILGQRLDFDEGSLTLVGNLDPQIHFVATTQSEDVTAMVTVSGSAMAPEITFSSEPELPQDEVLARILFNRSSDSLSAFQLAQLAAAAAELAGGGGGGVMERLRTSTGLDDLDIITEENGSTAVRAGRYVSDNVYVDVQTGSDGVSRAEVQVQLKPSVQARGSVGSDGNTTLGLFYERDY